MLSARMAWTGEVEATNLSLCAAGGDPLPFAAHLDLHRVRDSATVLVVVVLQGEGYDVNYLFGQVEIKERGQRNSRGPDLRKAFEAAIRGEHPILSKVLRARSCTYPFTALTVTRTFSSSPGKYVCICPAAYRSLTGNVAMQAVEAVRSRAVLTVGSHVSHGHCSCSLGRGTYWILQT